MSFFAIAVGMVLASQGPGGSPSGALESQLRGEDSRAIAGDARRLGDARRGAVLFYQPSLTCTKCHVSEAGAPTLGPDLTALGKDATDAYLVESILDPSKEIKKGYETVTISTEDGRIITGLLAEDRPDAVRAPRPRARTASPVTIPEDQIDERRSGGASIMPPGLVNNLGTRQQFLDLVRYLMEIAEKGPARARELKPDLALLEAGPAARVRARHRSRRAHRRTGAAKASSAGRRSTTACASTATARRTGWARCRPRFALPREPSRTAPTLQHVPHADPRVRPDDAADLDGAKAEVRRDPLHPRGLSRSPTIAASSPWLIGPTSPGCPGGRAGDRSRSRSSPG